MCAVRLAGRSMLDFSNYTKEEIEALISKAMDYKYKGYPKLKPLEGKTLALLFEKPSTRTRVSFEVAINKLGAKPIYLSRSEIQLGRGEPIKDTAKVMSRYVDAIIARMYKHEDLIELDAYSDVPVINALTDKFHPCQALADLMTMIEVKKGVKGIKIAYVGDSNNVCNSLLQICSIVGIDIAIASPKGYQPNEGLIKQASNWAKMSGCKIMITEEPYEAVKGADFVYTDVFVSMGQENEREKRMKVFYPKYQVNEKLMEKAKEGAYFMHCMPAKRGEEVEASIIDSSRSLVIQQAENRLHTSASLLSLILLS